MTEIEFGRIASYKILDNIGGGGMAQVFLAEDSRSGRRVALRLVRTRDSDVMQAEQRGAELHEHFWSRSKSVPEIFETGTAGGMFFVAMEYLDGKDLSSLISEGPLDPARAVEIAVSLCRFLEDAQEFQASVDGRQLRHLLHGDLTPRNVRMTSDGRVRVLDFGIAKTLSASRKVTHNDFGSIAYLSPERLDNGEMDATDGFWSIGVMLYEMVRGEQPFRAADTRRLEQRIKSLQPPEPLNGHCPAGLHAVIAKLLAPSPSDRYESARAIREDLERQASGVQTLAEQAGWPGRAHEQPATRRTRPAVVGVPESEDETTRRTMRPTFQPPPLPWEAAAQANANNTTTAARSATPLAARAGGTPPVPTRSRRLPRAVAPGLVIAALILFANESCVGRGAGRVAATVRTTEIADLPAVWATYDTFSQRSYLHFGVHSLERALIFRTQTLADRVISNYATGVSAIRETQWKQAKAPLTLATRAVPDDSQIRASLRLVEGHLHRIDGDANKERDQLQAAQQEYAEALTAFREAAELRPNWPDPFLGLSRAFIYSLADLERGEDALNQAQRLGYKVVQADVLLLADGYRKRGDALASNARTLAQTAQEQEWLARASAAYKRSIELYSSVAGGNVPRSVRSALAGLDRVEQRLNVLANPPGPEDIAGGANLVEQLAR
jgi:hypothetical protein